MWDGGCVRRVAGDSEPLEGPAGEADALATLGAQTLETFLLGVDPDQRQLVPLGAWWALSIARG